VFVANKKALLERKEVLDVAHEMLERFEAHLTAQGQFTVGIETLDPTEPIPDISVLSGVMISIVIIHVL
jgi:hypothetical protein